MAANFGNFIKKVPNVNPPRVSSDVIHGCIGVGSAVIFGGYITVHTFILDKYRDLYQLYKNGFATPLTPETKAKVQQVAKDMKLSEKYQGYVRGFYTSTMDAVHMGSFKLRGGAYVGIPASFTYKSTQDIDRDLILMQGKQVPWSSEAGELFQDSLILSENAQKFVIARELCHLNTHYVHNFALISSGSFLLQYIGSAYLNFKTYGHFKPASFRYTIYTVVGIFTFGIWSFATDSLNRYYENYADKNASALGIDYARGAVELYTKLARRNIACRDMLGAEGEKLYTKYGNYNKELIRQRYIPISVRKESAEMRVQEILGVNNNTN